MKPWKPIALIVPAGLLLGMAAGTVNRPVPIQRAEDPWPASVAERQARVEAPRPFYEAGPQDLSPASYSYRPNLDYAALAWPDQQAPDYETPVYDFGPDELPVVDAVPEVHRGATQAAGERAEQAVDDARAAAADVAEAGGAQVAAVTLPAVPEPVAPFEAEAF